MNEHIIEIVELVGSHLCIASEDGEKVHSAIVSSLKAGTPVRISFSGVEDLTSAFLNAAIGQLYGEFDESFLKQNLLPPINASPDHLHLLKRVVDRAKSFFKDPQRFEQATDEVLGKD